MSVGEVVAVFRDIVKDKSAGFYTTAQGVHVNIQKLPDSMTVEDVLTEGAQFEATTQTFDGSVNVIYNFQDPNFSQKFQKMDTLQAVFDHFEKTTGLRPADYQWRFRGKEYRPAADQPTLTTSTAKV